MITCTFDEDKSYQFLMGLSSKLYGQMRSQILAKDPLPPLEKIFNMVTQEEQHKHVMTSRDERTETIVAFTISHRDKTQPLTEKEGCKNSGKFGHKESNCYEVIRYPPSWGSRGKNRGYGRGVHRGQASGSRGRGPGLETAYSAGQPMHYSNNGE